MSITRGGRKPPALTEEQEHMEQIKKCPHCNQNMMIYRRNIRSNMLYCLHRLYFTLGNVPTKTRDIDARSNVISDFPKLRFWGLVEEQDGKWLVTTRGHMYLLGNVSLKKYKWIYNNGVMADQAENPRLYIWDICPEKISKAIVLKWATSYTVPGTEKSEQQELAF